MDVQLRPGRLTGLRCPQPQCLHAEVWLVSMRDWECSGRILLYCRNGHLLAWRARQEAGKQDQPSVPCSGPDYSPGPVGTSPLMVSLSNHEHVST